MEAWQNRIMRLITINLIWIDQSEAEEASKFRRRDVK